jgi:lipoprotein NlpI
VLNRGVVLEQLGAFDAALADYGAVLAVSPADPAAWNNTGNARMGKRDYAQAARDYGRAVALAPAFSFAAANRSIALYASGALGMRRTAVGATHCLSVRLRAAGR